MTNSVDQLPIIRNLKKICVSKATEGQVCSGDFIQDVSQETRCETIFDCVDIRGIDFANKTCLRPCQTTDQCILSGHYCSLDNYCLEYGQCALTVEDCDNELNLWTPQCNGSSTYYCSQNATCQTVCDQYETITCDPKVNGGAYICPEAYYCNTTSSVCILGELAACSCPASPVPTPRHCSHGYHSEVICDTFVQYGNCSWQVGACLYSSASVTSVLSFVLLLAAFAFSC